jgi:biopolymer transport protein ExbD
MPIKTLPQEEPTLNLTPMIDVILTLILFFMVATKFSEEERNINVNLPKTSKSAASAQSASPKFINVKSDGGILFGNRPVTLPELTQQLKTLRTQSKNIQVVVRGDANATHGRMSEVYEAIQAAGISGMGIASKFNGQVR